jgi:hypothetical protein
VDFVIRPSHRKTSINATLIAMRVRCGGLFVSAKGDDADQRVSAVNVSAERANFFLLQLEAWKTP